MKPCMKAIQGHYAVLQAVTREDGGRYPGEWQFERDDANPIACGEDRENDCVRWIAAGDLDILGPVPDEYVRKAFGPDSGRYAALPSAVVAWYVAEEARIEAVGKYNGKLAAAKEHGFPGPDVSAEFKVMTDTGNAAHRLLRPMYEAIAAMAAQQGEKLRTISMVGDSISPLMKFEK